MPYVNGEYVMPGGDDSMFDAGPLRDVVTECVDPLCDECILPHRLKRRRQGGTTGASQPTAESAASIAAQVEVVLDRIIGSVERSATEASL